MKIKYIVALMTVIATAGGCTQDTGEQLEEATPIKFAVTIAPTETGKTRAPGDWGERTTTLTQGTEFLNGEHVFVYIKENDGTHTSNIKWPIEYMVANDGDGDADDGDLNPVSDTTPFFFPVGVNTINIHAIHPSCTSGTGFTVLTDQTTETNYVASDLCYSKPTDYTRTGSGSDIDANGRRILQFKHLLSKIVVNLTLDANVPGATLPTSIKLHAKTSTAMSYPETNANGYTGCTASDASNPGIITMIQEAIIPPQEIAGGASFLSFSVTGIGPMIYPMPAATTFESGKMYTYNIRVKNVGITATTDIDDWGTTVNGGIVMGQPGEEYKKNPLWYVAEYNLKSDLTFDKSTDARYQGYIFKWNQGTYSAMNLGFTANTTGYNGYALPNPSKTVSNGESGVTWHLPTAMELQSILPSALNSKNILNHSSFPNSYTAGVVVTEPACTFGYNNDTKYGEGNSSNPASPTGTAFKSYWSAYTANSDVRYAIRFLGTPYCSVWKYQMLNGSTTNARLIISAKLIDKINDDNTSAMAAKMTEITNGGYDWSENLENGAIVRTFYICGFNEATEGNSPGGTRSLTEVDFWSATPNPSNNSQAVFMRVWTDNTLYLGYDGITRGFNVRLFRDN